jgi:hypothetical protein
LSNSSGVKGRSAFLNWENLQQNTTIGNSLSSLLGFHRSIFSLQDESCPIIRMLPLRIFG